MKTLASLVIVAIFLGGCGGDDGNGPEVGSDAAIDSGDAMLESGVDAACAPSVTSGAACTLPGLACASATELCHCIAPENTWLCCPQTVDINCVKGPPFDRVGQQCCPTGVRYGCAVCHADASREEVTCSDSDPHWRLATTTCAPPSSDAGAE